MSPSDQEKASLLPAKTYDKDAPTIDPASGNESDDGLSTVDGRPSIEVAQRDLEVLEEDYESDHGPGSESTSTRRGIIARIFRRAEDNKYEEPMHQRKKQPSRRHRERLRRGEESAEMMYEMEEGGEASQTPSRNSSEVDLLRLEKVQRGKYSRRQSILRHCLIHGTIIGFFLLLMYAAYLATTKSRRTLRALPKLVSNGTSLFAPTTILISLDGFRADFLQRGLTPTLNSFIKEGVSPLYMTPPFPSVTFVSHYTMSTGLHAEQHGIVGNTFWDPDMKEEFYYTQTEVSMQPKWWGGEPFWVTAERQGVKTAIHMWPGSEAGIGGVKLTHVDTFKASELLPNKVNRILEWIDLPGPESPEKIADSLRPQLIAAYVPNVDTDGHEYGPNSTEIRSTIKNADNMLEGIFAGIRERNLTHIVNIIVVSDHGMATTSVDRLIQLDDLIDVNKIEHIDGWPLWGLRPKRDEDIELLYQQLKSYADKSPNFDVYLRDKNMPAEYHFSQNKRIAPLWIVPKTGWAIVKKQDFDVVSAKQEGKVYSPRGLHGYDFRHPLMRAIFVARGPSFPHKANSRVETFQNIDLYNIICDSVGIEPNPNNGTLRLPFKPIGLHTDNDAPVLGIPDDMPEHGTGPENLPTSSSSAAAGLASTQTNEAPAVATSKPDSGSEEPETEKPKPGDLSWWEWLSGKVDDAVGSIKQLFGGS